ncbi:MAG: ATP12 family protein [Pseudomonadota bacterium]|nr:ATP12 family protein [Pseudomonadota bacterium]
MTGWAKKRFWKEATICDQEGGFGVQLDGRLVKTPAKRTLLAPTEACAVAIAQEWQDQPEEIDPSLMPLTRAVNAAIDKVATQFDEVADLTAAYGETDLLCYRATSPAELIARQAEGWDPVLDWAATQFGARLKPTAGIIHIAQDAAALDALRGEVLAKSHYELTALHEMVALTGSLILGLAAFHDFAPVTTIWDLSRIDEAWQEEQWGPDEEAQKITQRKLADFIQAKSFQNLIQRTG